MTRFTVIGSGGFVGSALVRRLRSAGVDLRPVTRENYSSSAGLESDVVIDASGNSTKYLADRDPSMDFDRSVAHRLQTLRDFPSMLQVHISSVDVYSDLTSPATTREETGIEIEKCSHYGFHKYLAEEVVRHYARRWLIVRLAGMVGVGLRKNPVYDLLTGSPLRIHPDSRYQFASTDDVATIICTLVQRGMENEIVNVCGSGLISPREIAQIAGREMNLTTLDASASPRIVHASIEKIERIIPMPKSSDAVRDYVLATSRVVQAG